MSCQHQTSTPDLTEDKLHQLLDPPYPAYSHLTVRRAFIAWLHCGVSVEFRVVCNYYHRLEALEDMLSSDIRASSRHHEFHLFSNPPPTSPFQKTLFPQLYSHNNIRKRYIEKVESIMNEPFVFHTEGFNKIDFRGVKREDVITLNHMINKHCKERLISTRQFLNDYTKYSKRSGLRFTIDNVIMYIRKKAIKEEIQLEARMPVDFGFLNVVEDKKKTKRERKFGVRLAAKLSDLPKQVCNINVTHKPKEEKPKTVEEDNLTPYMKFYNNQMKLLKAVAPKPRSKHVELIEASDTDSDVTEYSDFANFLDDHDKSSATDCESGIDCKSGDEIVQMTFLNRNGKRNIIYTEFVPFEKCDR